MPYKDKKQHLQKQKQYRQQRGEKKEAIKCKVEAIKCKVELIKDIIVKKVSKGTPSSEMVEDIVDMFGDFLSDRPIFESFVVPIINELKNQEVEYIELGEDKDLAMMDRETLESEKIRLEIRLDSVKKLLKNFETTNYNRAGKIIEQAGIVARSIEAFKARDKAIENMKKLGYVHNST